jgi:hypothetical protein
MGNIFGGNIFGRNILAGKSWHEYFLWEYF